MTIINPNSIAGITSVTAQADIINFYKSDGNQAGLGLNGVNFNTTAGISTFNNLVVGGTLTYEDVKNVDSVGIITARDHINIVTDGKKLQIGAGQDLQFWHNGGTGNSNIKQVTGNLYFYTGSDISMLMQANGAVNLYYNNSLKFSTTSSGVDCPDQLQVDGTTFATGGLKINADSQKLRIGAGDDLWFEHNGSNSKINNTTGTFYIQGDIISLAGNGGSHNLAVFTKTGSVDLYYNNSKKFETTSTGVSVTGAITASQGGTITGNTQFNGAVDIGDDNGSNYHRVRLGASQDLSLWHDGTNSYVSNTTGDLFVQTAASKAVYIRPNNGANGIICHPAGAVDLYHNANKKLETTTSGISVTGLTQTDGLEVQDDGYGGTTCLIKTDDEAPWAFQIRNDTYNAGSCGFKVYQANSGVVTQQIRGNSAYVDYWITQSNGSTGRNMIKISGGGAVELYYASSKKLETTNNGGTLTGDWFMTTGGYLSFPDNVQALFGTGTHLRIYSDGTNNEIRSSGARNIYIRPNNGEVGIKVVPNGAVELYHDDSKRFETSSTGNILQKSNVFIGTGDTWADSSGGIKITGNTPGSRGSISMYYDTNVLEMGAGITQKNRMEIHAHSGDNAIKYFVNGAQRGSWGSAGLRFGTDTATANSLDDYEEGSWTPTPDDLSNTPQYYNRVGNYTKIGNLVYAIGFLQFGSNPQPQFNSTNLSLTVSGLPFPCDAGTGYVGCVGNVTYQSMNWSGGTYNDYGATSKVIAGANNQSKTTFRVDGTNNTIRGTLRRAAWHNSSCIITWEMVYRTNS